MDQSIELLVREAAAGDRAAARLHLESALAIPGSDFEADVVLVKELVRELQEWEDSRQRPNASPSVPKADSPGLSSSSTTSTPANE